MSLIKDVIFMFFPPESKRGKWLKKKAMKLNMAKSYTSDATYQHWIDSTENYSFIAPIEDDETDLDKLPNLSIVIPMYNTKDKYLEPLLYSIINQSYSRWELILADASTEESRSDAIKTAASQDKRIKYVKLNKNKGISGNTNQALKRAKSDYVVFMDHDDTLNPHALNEVAAVILDNQNVEIIYSDEDKLTDDGTVRHTPHFKPDWSPHQYLSCNWTSHLSIVRTDLARKVGGLRPGMDGAQDYDFILRLLALPGERAVVHIPKVLYHWRVADGSTAGDFDQKGYAVTAGEKALSNYVKTKGWICKVSSIPNRPGFYRTNFKPNPSRKALVILDASANVRLNRTLLERLRLSSSSNIPTMYMTKRDFDVSKRRILDDLSDKDFIFTINGYYSTLDTKWLDELCGVLELSDVRAISPRILTSYDSIKDMGIVVDSQGNEHELFNKLHRHAGTVFGHVEWVRDVARVTGRFYGANKLNWIKLDNTITINDSDDSSIKTYDVVWSDTNFRLESRGVKENSFFNSNLLIDEGSGVPHVWVK